MKQDVVSENVDDAVNSSNDDDDSEQDEPEYELESIVIDGRISLEIWSVVPPPLEYLAQLSTKRQEISGRQVWTGSLALSHVLCRLHKQDPTYFDHKRILELGSGTGVVGMVVSKLAGSASSSSSLSSNTSSTTTISCIALTDGDVQAVHLLDQNLKNPVNDIPSHHAKARLLWWGNHVVSAGEDGKDASDDTNAQFEDWCRQEWNTVWKDEEPVQFDRLLAGDVLYKAELPKLFFETVERYMTRSPEGVLWLCHVPRASVTHEIVVEAAQQAGFHVELHWKSNDDETLEGCPMEDLKRANVYKITRAAHNSDDDV